MEIRGEQGLSILLLNFSSTSSHMNDLRNFLSLVRQKFNMICISEIRTSTKNPKTTNRDFPGENIEQTPTESSAREALVYIFQSFSYNTRRDLHIYCVKALESAFIELLILNKKNHLVGVIYEHATMKHHKFNNDFMNTLFDKITKENKSSVI